MFQLFAKINKRFQVRFCLCVVLKIYLIGSLFYASHFLISKIHEVLCLTTPSINYEIRYICNVLAKRGCTDPKGGIDLVSP